MRALEYGQDDVVELLLKAGANPDLTAYNRQFSALRIAAMRAASGSNATGVPMPGAARQFQILLASHKVDLNAPSTYDGNTPLTGAVSIASVAIARQMLEAGADPNAPNRGQMPPLIVAIEAAVLNAEYQREKYVDMVRLIARWPGVRKDALYQGKTALQWAQAAKRQDLVQILQDTGP
jgi:ankyrin repeat protein